MITNCEIERPDRIDFEMRKMMLWDSLFADLFEKTPLAIFLAASFNAGCKALIDCNYASVFRYALKSISRSRFPEHGRIKIN